MLKNKGNIVLPSAATIRLQIEVELPPQDRAGWFVLDGRVMSAELTDIRTYYADLFC